MPKLQEVKGRFFISLPASLVKRKGWQKGQELFFAFNERGELSVRD